MRLRQVFLWSMVVSLGLDAVLGIAAILLPRGGPGGETLGSAALFAGFSLLAMLCAIVLERRRLVPLMWLGIGCAGTALVPWLALIWLEGLMDWKVAEQVARIGGTFTVPPVIIAQCGLISLVRLDERWGRLVRLGTHGSSALLGAYVLALLWWWQPLERLFDDDNLWRALGVISILALCGTVMTPIVWKVQAVRRAATAESIPVKVQVRLTCPRCGCEQSLSAGRGACERCGLRIALEIEEPRCACGYLLHGLSGERCPECGRAPGAEQKPAAVGRSRGVRLAPVAGLLPCLLLLVFAGHWTMFRGEWVRPVPPPTPVQSASFFQTSELNQMILGYDPAHSGGPGHAIALAAVAHYRPPAELFCDPVTRTAAARVPVGDGTLDVFTKASRTDQLITVGNVLRAMPAGVVAHRLGDFVFTYHGAVLNTNDQQLWTLVMLPDPDANGLPAPGDAVFIGTAGYRVFETTFEELPDLLEEQNRHRATLNLPTLPELITVTHRQPALAPGRLVSAPAP